MINLLINYYVTSDEVRQKEIDFCFINNVLNQFINKIHCFVTEEDYEKLETRNDKIIFTKITERPTYYDYFKYANDNIDEGEIIIIGNSDIYYDSSVRILPEILGKTDVCALTRWGADGNTLNENTITMYQNAKCSQDAWIYINKLQNLENMDCKFNLGVNRCDNRIAYEFHNNGYNVFNPCLDIIIYHYHTSGIRNNYVDFIDGQIAYVEPLPLTKKH